MERRKGSETHPRSVGKKIKHNTNNIYTDMFWLSNINTNVVAGADLDFGVCSPEIDATSERNYKESQASQTSSKTSKRDARTSQEQPRSGRRAPRYI